MVLDGFVLDRRAHGYERQVPRSLDQGPLRPSFGLRNHPPERNVSTGSAAVMLLRTDQAGSVLRCRSALRVAPGVSCTATFTA